MSKYNEYGRKVDRLARGAFDAYKKAEKKYKEAIAERDKYPERTGPLTPEYVARSARAKANYIEAQEQLKGATAQLARNNETIAQLRADLAGAIEADTSASPASMDLNTMELLKSGVLKPAEYKRLMASALEKENYTMARIIGKYAGEGATATEKKDPATARALREVSYMGNTGSAELKAFDHLADAYKRTSNNPAMIGYWDRLTADTVENF